MNPGRESGPLSESAYRADIQGLRAVAVLLVVFNHVGLSFVRGGYVGVDVFFVVSGFLITGLLLRGGVATKRIDLLDFYARRARRILPAAALTLAVTDVAAWALLNYVRAQAAIKDSIWAAFFAANIRFERIGTDYFARSTSQSPIQHFWSLAVEEQFYLVWPFLLALLWFGPQWFRYLQSRENVDTTTRAGRRVLGALLVAVALSLAWSVRQTSLNPVDAYFSPFARAWELGIGAALAVAAPLVAKAPPRIKALASWLGLVGIVAASVWYSESTPFPGSAALLPVLSTALVIAGGMGAASRLGAGALLSLAPFRLVGDVSYSFYLWHWPFLVIPTAFAADQLSVGVKSALVAAAFATAVVTYFLVENPIRRSRRLWSRSPSRSGGLVLWPASLAVVLAVSAFSLHALQQVQADQTALSGPPPVQPSLATSAAPSSEPTIPEQVAAAVEAAKLNQPFPRMFPPVADVPSDYFDIPGCIANFGPPTQSQICNVGDQSSSRAMVVFGDSHAGMWLPALIPIATSEHWKLIPLIKDGCWAGAWGSGTCAQWYGWAVEQIRHTNPAVVIIGTCRNVCQLPTWASGMRAAIRGFKAMGARVIVLGDNPYLDRDSVDCLLAHGSTMQTCTFPLETWKSSLNIDSAETVRAAGAQYIDVQQWLCAEEMCPDVIGGLIVYRDNNHLTRTYVEQLAQPLSDELALDRSSPSAI